MKITEMEKQMYYAIGHQVEVKLKDGNICNGFCSGYTGSVDNEPEPAEIDIKKEGNMCTFHISFFFSYLRIIF